MNVVSVKSLSIGEGRTKVIIPLVGKNEAELFDELKQLNTVDYDVVEWRIDHFDQVSDSEAVLKMAKQMQSILIQKPLLITFRTHKEGGVKQMSDADYLALNLVLIKSGYTDLIDVEIESEPNLVECLITEAKKYNVKVITSFHDFQRTPTKDELIAKFIKMQNKGADILKIAVMPNSTQDVLTVLEATSEMKEKFATQPIVSMSMGKLGLISRISGATFGSSMTFGSLGNASAPGQLKVAELNQILTLIEQ